MRLVIATTLATAAVLSAAPAGADPQCDVYHRYCFPQYCYATGQLAGPYGYCPDALGPPYGRTNSRDAG